jgi:hypothetical protein
MDIYTGMVELIETEWRKTYRHMGGGGGGGDAYGRRKKVYPAFQKFRGVFSAGTTLRG